MIPEIVARRVAVQALSGVTASIPGYVPVVGDLCVYLAFWPDSAGSTMTFPPGEGWAARLDNVKVGSFRCMLGWRRLVGGDAMSQWDLTPAANGGGVKLILRNALASGNPFGPIGGLASTGSSFAFPGTTNPDHVQDDLMYGAMMQLAGTNTGTVVWNMPPPGETLLGAAAYTDVNCAASYQYPPPGNVPDRYGATNKNADWSTLSIFIKRESSASNDPNGAGFLPVTV